MSENQQDPPQWIDTAISNLLRTGVVVSMGVVIIGLVLTFIHHPQYVRSQGALGTLTDAGVIYTHRVTDVATQIRNGRGQGIVMLGLLMLIATPVARVAFSILAFMLERDRLYVAITTVVLALLLVSFAIGAAG